MDPVFCVVSKKLFPYLRSFRFSVLSSRSFTVLHFVCRLVIHSQLIFVEGVRSVSRFFFFFFKCGCSVVCLVQSLSHVQLFETPCTAACQASLFITNSQSPPKPMSIVSVMPYNHLILCCPLLLLPAIFPSIRVFSNESALRIRWPKY